MKPCPGLSSPMIPCSVTIALLLSLALACERGAEPPTPQVATSLSEVSGRYELSGVTTTADSDQKRRIRGTMVIERAGDDYQASFEFKTSFPGEGPPVDADVIGVGEGRVEGNRLIGTARTQIVVSAVPGVDTGFAFVPRMVSTRIVSTSVGEFGPDDSLHLEIENRAAEGEDYRATRTRMRGKRVTDPREPIADDGGD